MKFLRLLIRFLRFSIFTVLLFIRPIFGMVLGLSSGLCLFGFLFCLLFTTDNRTPLWAFFGAGVIATSLLWFFDEVLAFLAPEDQIIVSQK